MVFNAVNFSRGCGHYGSDAAVSPRAEDVWRGARAIGDESVLESGVFASSITLEIVAITIASAMALVTSPSV